MTIEIKGPPFESVRLPRVGATGSIVHANGKVSVVSIKTEREARGTPPLLLASFDPATSTFAVSNYDDQNVLAFGKDVIIEPDLSIPSERGSPGTASTSECYYNGREFFVRLNVPAAPDQYPILNLNSGEISTEMISQAYMFKRWRLGVRKTGRVTWVLAVGATLSAWATDAI